MLEYPMHPVQPSLQCYLNHLAPLYEADTTFATYLLIYEHVAPKSKDQCKCSFECPGVQKCTKFSANTLL